MTEQGPPTPRGQASSHRRLLLIAGLVVLAAVAGVALLATRQHAADTARAAAACSDLDRAAFEALSVNRPPVAPVGQADGACTLTLFLPGDAATALSALDAAMTSDGWTPNGGGAGPRLYSRGPDLITGVPGGSSGGTTEVILSIAPE
jgi:hypothetical protein